MTDAKKQADELAALKARVAELEARPQPPKPTDWAAEERAHKEWLGQMHEMRERRMSMAMHPSVIRDMAGGVSDADCRGIIQASHAPTGPTTQVPNSQPVAPDVPRNVPGGGTGWAREIPFGPSMHQRYVDQQIDAADAKDQIELAQRIAEQKAALGEK
jgi:hypothetical protein